LLGRTAHYAIVAAMKYRLCAWLLGMVRRWEAKLADELREDELEAFAGVVDEFYERTPAQLLMLAAAYWERTNVDPIHAVLCVTRDKAGTKHYQFTQVGE
jgi:hypothetical protein